MEVFNVRGLCNGNGKKVGWPVSSRFTILFGLASKAKQKKVPLTHGLLLLLLMQAWKRSGMHNTQEMEWNGEPPNNVLLHMCSGCPLCLPLLPLSSLSQLAPKEAVSLDIHTHTLFLSHSHTHIHTHLKRDGMAGKNKESVQPNIFNTISSNCLKLHGVAISIKFSNLLLLILLWMCPNGSRLVQC